LQTGTLDVRAVQRAGVTPIGFMEMRWWISAPSICRGVPFDFVNVKAGAIEFCWNLKVVFWQASVMQSEVQRHYEVATGGFPRTSW